MKKKSKAIITGIAGFAGSYLAELLIDRRYEVYGFLAPGEKGGNISHLGGKLNLDRFDIRKADKISRYVKSIKPAYIFHLAAFSSVGKSFASERLTYEINFIGTFNIFEAVKELQSKLEKLVFASSADIYGAFKPTGKILNESQPFNPNSPYGISKAAAEYLAQYYCNHHGLPVVISRSFNHTGPRHSEAFVVPSFCRQIARIEKGGVKKNIAVGDLSAKRDLSDVRDIVNGYFLMARKGRPGEVFQLCSGHTVAIKTVLNKLLGMAAVPIKIKTDKSRLRKSDIPVLKGDNSRAKNQLGWKNNYELEHTLSDTLQYWREKLSAKPKQG